MTSGLSFFELMTVKFLARDFREVLNEDIDVVDEELDDASIAHFRVNSLRM
jgi:hypothetical protein